MNEKIIYYKDELNDEFSKAQIKPRKIDYTYKYLRNPIWDFSSLIIQNILSMPIKIGYAKGKFKIKYIGKEKLKECKKQGYFLYGNHTQAFADTFIPSIAVYPKRNFLIVNPANVSVKPFGGIVEMLGAMPIPCDKNGMINMLHAIQRRVEKGNSITIYPEAHIWPYYTKIRPFKDVSFKYPVKFDKPAYCFTNTYQKRKNKVQIVTYIDGPFFANKRLNFKEQQKDLRDRIYNTMVERSKNNNIEVIRYEKQS